MTRIADVVVPGSLRTEVRAQSYVTVRCGRCSASFEARAECKTTRCKECGRTCRLSHPAEASPNVIPLRRSA
jgi:hypothetical protein